MPPIRPHGPEEIAAYLAALGNVVREHRKPLFNQDDFADKVGIYRSHMGQIEQGKLDIRVSTLLGVAAALEMPLSALIALVEERQRQDSAAQED
ncbi:hypothetical protein Dxin01_03508 [Deinococcus xinjiangensis]|uniref:HTH cro/C1-type domain-containing protein n=1 Tax=Deinococcus xinjiangensis TaxID=457454 RepID=A0ABP9VET1_9DEIO